MKSESLQRSDGLRRSFFSRACQRFLANDMLARFRRFDARLGMRVIRAAVVEELNPIVLEHLLPIGVIALVAIAQRGFFGGVFIAPADGN